MIFVDTSFWVALINRRDPRCEQARSLIEAHANDRLMTSSDVRGETWTFLRRRTGHAEAVGFLDTIAASPRLEVMRVSQASEADAERWLRTRDDREFSWVDATGFAIMRELRITDAFAFDGDFAAAGFSELRT
ncbi:MAG: type II toxin-antitoxin system VapC family toxin [Solirubrobacteraceae bacterium]